MLIKNRKRANLLINLAPLLIHFPRVEKITNAFKVLHWLEELKKDPKIADWVEFITRAVISLAKREPIWFSVPTSESPPIILEFQLDRGFCGTWP